MHSTCVAVPLRASGRQHNRASRLGGGTFNILPNPCLCHLIPSPHCFRTTRCVARAFPLPPPPLPAPLTASRRKHFVRHVLFLRDSPEQASSLLLHCLANFWNVARFSSRGPQSCSGARRRNRWEEWASPLCWLLWLLLPRPCLDHFVSPLVSH
jgi:hypothetical protein